MLRPWRLRARSAAASSSRQAGRPRHSGPGAHRPSLRVLGSQPAAPLYAGPAGPPRRAPGSELKSPWSAAAAAAPAAPPLSRRAGESRGGRRCGTGWSLGRKAGPGPGAGGWRVGVGANRGNGTCAASWPPRRPARRGGHPDAFSLWVTGPRRTRTRGRAAPQVSPSGSRLRAWWEVRARGCLELAGGPHAVPTRATPGASQASLSPRGVGAARIMPGPFRGLLGLHNLGFPHCPGSPETGGGTRRGPSTRPAGSYPPPEPEQQRDVEGVRRRLVRTLLLSRAPLGFRSSSPVPPPA